MEGRGHSSPSVEGQRLMQMISMIHACHITEHRKEKQENKNGNKETLFCGSSTIN